MLESTKGRLGGNERSHFKPNHGGWATISGRADADRLVDRGSAGRRRPRRLQKWTNEATASRLTTVCTGMAYTFKSQLSGGPGGPPGRRGPGIAKTSGRAARTTGHQRNLLSATLREIAVIPFRGPPLRSHHEPTNKANSARNFGRASPPGAADRVE